MGSSAEHGHLESTLTVMMLERAAREATQGKLDNALRLVRMVILCYPSNGIETSGRQQKIEQQLLGPIDQVDRSQVSSLISKLSEARTTYSNENTMSGHIETDPQSDEIDLAVAIISEIVPEFEYSAHRMYEQFKHETELETRPSSSGLTFGGGDAPQELIQLMLACMPVIQFIAGIGLGGFLPAYLSGRKSDHQLKEISDRLRQREEQDSKWREAILHLKEAHVLARDIMNAPEIEDLLARALARVASEIDEEEE